MPLRLAPPMLPKNTNPNAALLVEPTLVGPPAQLPTISAANWGDPRAPLFNDSPGPGKGGGFGSKCCGAIGDKDGDGFGEAVQPGTPGYSLPVCTYCPNPTFTDEAIKAKYQGTVMIRLVVTARGEPVNLTVVKGIGLGMDERALETVRRWRFQPALGPDGKPSPTWVLIEVQFRQF